MKLNLDKAGRLSGRLLTRGPCSLGGVGVLGLWGLSVLVPGVSDSDLAAHGRQGLGRAGGGGGLRLRLSDIGM